MFYLIGWLLLILTGSPSFSTRAHATQALCWLQSIGAVPRSVLAFGLQHRDPEVRARARIVETVPVHLFPRSRGRIRFAKVEDVPYEIRGQFEVEVTAETQSAFDQAVRDVFTVTGALLQSIEEVGPRHRYVLLFSH